MIRYRLRVLKRNSVTGKLETREIELPGLDEILTPEEVFIMEYKLNEIASIRFHIEGRE